MLYVNKVHIETLFTMSAIIFPSCPVYHNSIPLLMYFFLTQTKKMKTYSLLYVSGP